MTLWLLFQPAPSGMIYNPLTGINEYEYAVTAGGMVIYTFSFLLKFFFLEKIDYIVTNTSFKRAYCSVVDIERKFY